MSQRESGREVKMPVAAEEAKKLAEPFREHPSDIWYAFAQAMIADIQRRTLLAAADGLAHRGASSCETFKNGKKVRRPIWEWLCGPTCDKCRVERLAASLGEPGK